MAITRSDVYKEREFHYEHPSLCQVVVGPRGGVTYKTETWKANGMIKEWKRSPERFSLPIKYGFKGRGSYITEDDLENWHTVENCPVTQYFRELDAVARRSTTG